jgi:pilus assembly protein FimV
MLEMPAEADVLTESIPVDTDAMLVDVDAVNDETPAVRLDRLDTKSPPIDDMVVDRELIASDVDSDTMRSVEDVVLRLVLSESSPDDIDVFAPVRVLFSVVRVVEVEPDNVLRLLLVAVSASDVDSDSAEIELLAVAKRSAVDADSESSVALATLMLVDSVISPVDAELDRAATALFALDRLLAVEDDNVLISLSVVDRVVPSESMPLDADAAIAVRLLFVADRLVLSPAMDVDADDESDEMVLLVPMMPVEIELRSVAAEVERLVRFEASVACAVESELTPDCDELTTVLSCATVATSCGAEPSATFVSRLRLLALPIDTSPFAVVPVP